MGRRNDNLILDKTLQFAVRIVHLYKYLNSKGEYVLSKQLLRSGTSIGANLREAIEGISKSDFIAKSYISLKEARETEYWLEILHLTEYISDKEFKSINSDLSEILKILVTIIKNSKG